ncbi:MAG: hypothetical protein HKL99_14055 [Burkholderiales bacterium]|nr:hypothetical protein [Burkholderiales bacterium]
MLAPLLAGYRLRAVREALEAMPQSTAAQAAWEAIRAPAKPTLADAVAWGLDQVEQYAGLTREGPGADVTGPSPAMG